MFSLLPSFRSLCHLSVPLILTNHPRHFVKRKALVTADGEALVVVIPRSQQQELTTGTGIHALSAGLGKVGKAVLLQEDEGQALIDGGRSA